MGDSPDDEDSILIVDDDETVRKMLPLFLSDLGKVTTMDSTGMDVGGATEAIRAQLHQVRHIILDGRYDKGGTAVQIVEALQDDLEARGTKVTGYSSDEEILYRLRKQFPCITGLTKGLDNDKLVSTIQTAKPFTVTKRS